MSGITNPAEEYFKNGLWAWDPAGGVWLKLIIDPLTNRLVIDHPGDLEVVQPVPNDLRVGNYGWDGSAWRKLPMVWGYSGTYQEAESETVAVAGDKTLTASTVPDGEVWVVTNVLAFNSTTVNTWTVFEVYDGANVFEFRRKAGPAADEEVIFTGHLVLSVDDRIRARFYGCQVNDYIALRLLGYKMKVAE